MPSFFYAVPSSIPRSPEYFRVVPRVVPGSGRPAGRVGLGRVGSGILTKAAGRVGSGPDLGGSGRGQVS